MKQGLLWVVLAFGVLALSACNLTDTSAKAGVQVTMLTILPAWRTGGNNTINSPPLLNTNPQNNFNGWGSQGTLTAPPFVPNRSNRATYTFEIVNSSDMPYYGGVWLLTVNNRTFSYGDTRDEPVELGEIAIITVVAAFDDSFGYEMWVATHAAGLNDVSIRITSFNAPGASLPE